MLISLRSTGVRRIAAAMVLPAAALSSSACTAGSDSESARDVIVGFYPLEFLASAIGGDITQVENLAQAGAEPHDMELTARQVGAIGAASLVIHQQGLQPAVDDVIDNEKPERVLDVATVVEQIETGGQSEGDEHAGESPDEHVGESEGDEHAGESAGEHADHGSLDPHVWLDPMLMKSMAEAIKDEMVDMDPANEETYVANYETVAAELDALDEEFTAGLAQCERTEIVTTHTAFGYLAAAYGLEQVGILGLSGEEPSPQQLAEVEQFVTEHGVTTIFFESGVSDDYAATVAESTGAQTSVLAPLESAPDSGDYISAMKLNLEALRTALSCA